MNDRAVSVLENYDFEIVRTQKSRNAILCETNKGWMILKEYRGQRFRLELLEKLLEEISDSGFGRAEHLIRTKEGELICLDQEQTPCIVKTWPGGGECSLKDGQECRAAVAALATLHKAMRRPELAAQSDIRAQSLLEEYEKRNRERYFARRRTRGKEPFSTGTSSIIIFCSPAGLPLSTSRSSVWAARCGISICSCASCWRRPTGLSLWREGFWTSTGGKRS